MVSSMTGGVLASPCSEEPFPTLRYCGNPVCYSAHMKEITPLHQQYLFPADAEEQFLGESSKLYKALSDDEQALVRAYVKVHRDSKGRPTRAEWIAASGLSRTHAYDLMKTSCAKIWNCLREVQGVLGERGAWYGGAALVIAGQQIYDNLKSGARGTGSLTSVELGVMRECALMSAMTMIPTTGKGKASVRVTDADGRTIEVSAEGGADSRDAIDSTLDELMRRQRRTLGGVAQGGRADGVQAEADLSSDRGSGGQSAGSGQAEGACPAGEGLVDVAGVQEVTLGSVDAVLAEVAGANQGSGGLVATADGYARGLDFRGTGRLAESAEGSEGLKPEVIPSLLV